MERKKLVLWIIIGILSVLVIYVTFFKGAVDSNTLNAGKTAGQVVASSSGMVGGC